MRWTFIFHQVYRELKSNWRKTGFFTLSIFLGVASLVAVKSFSENLKWSVELQSKNLKGSDLTISSQNIFPETINTLKDSLVQLGLEVSNTTQFLSMVLNPANGHTRLVQVRTNTGGFPWYGEIISEPDHIWADLQSKKTVLLDDALRYQLEIEQNDSLKIGEAYFIVAGFIKKMPGDNNFNFGASSKIYFSGKYLNETNLIQFGSRVRYAYEFKTPMNYPLASLSDTLKNKYQTKDSGIRIGSYLQREQNLGESIDRVSNFLGLVSMIALLLGGVGVASSINVFVRQKLETIAILRCLGATGVEVASIYLLISLTISSIGILLGIVFGIGIQFLLPGLLSAYLPIDLYIFISWDAIWSGLITGLVITLLFGLFPISRVLKVSPLNALRQDMSDQIAAGFGKRISLLLGIIFISTIWYMAVLQADSKLIGTGFTIGIGVALVVLYFIAWLIVKFTKVLRLKSLSYPIRQGLSNLYRPNNQTVTLVLALGFGVFLILSIYLVQKGLLSQLQFGDAENRPNLIMFDIQRNQKDSLESVMKKADYSYSDLIPIIPARMININGAPADSRLDSLAPISSRNNFMITYRWKLASTEEIVGGTWFSEDKLMSAPEVSVDESYAKNYHLKLGDELEFDILGIRKTVKITSLRKVNWTGMSPNFLFVFKPGELDKAPQTFVTSLHVSGTENRSNFQRDIVGRFPNIMAVDLTVVMETVDSVLEKISLIIQFMGGFSILTGLIVVIGAVANGKYQRIKEAALLRTLGGIQNLIRSIFTIEFVVLGTLSAITGAFLAYFSTYLIMDLVFKVSYAPPIQSLLMGILLTSLLMITIGWLINSGILKKKPLEVLREN